MIISIDWLKDFIEINETPEELAELLSKIGLEAEVKNDLYKIKNVVIAYVKETSKHPNADKLKICQVYDGSEVYQVVCGAPNISSGQKIAFAKVGSVLHGKFKIKKAKIRGVESFGMICSENELGISDNHDGIMVLPNDLDLGRNFVSEYGKKFISIELDITPNRPDALSHYGIARDLACAKNRNLSQIHFNEPKYSKKEKINISIENVKDCSTYVGGVISGIKVSSSPKWIVDRLKSVGQKSINNIVDISNYVLLEIGHPTHIFDYNKIHSKKIFVRRANKTEKLITLDGSKRLLDNESLVISDEKSPIALAGVMGGLETGVSKDTDTIFIESAFFNPVTIRKSSKKNQLSTDASKKFERGSDPLICLRAFYRVIELIQKVAGGKLISNHHKSVLINFKVKRITLRYSELDLVLGIKIKEETVNNILTRLGFLLVQKKGFIDCSPPSYRPDITREIDLIEEIARIVGYDSIKSDENLYGFYKYGDLDTEESIDHLKNLISNMGFHQVYSNSLESDKISTLTGKKPIKMLNPLNKNMSFLRTSLIPGLSKASDLNIKNNKRDFRIYELGNVHQRIGSGLKGIKEEKYLALITHGMQNRKSLFNDDIAEDLFNLKGTLIAVFSSRFNLKIEFIEKDYIGFDHSYVIKINRLQVGGLGIVSDKILRKMDIDIDILFGCEINLTPIQKMLNGKKVFNPINIYPKIKRDLNFILSEKQEVGPISDLIIKVGKGIIIFCNPTNIYKDAVSIGKNLKSVTYSIEFQHHSRTLEEKDVRSIIQEIISSAKTQFDAILRS